MSGRVRTRLADGRTVTGYRKTLEQRGPHVPAHEMPDWRVTLPLPGALYFSVAAGARTGVIGVSVASGGMGPQIEARGKEWHWVFAQAVAYLAKVLKGHDWQGRITARIERDAYPGPTMSGPMGPAINETRDFIVVQEPSVVIPRPYDEPLILPMKVR